MKAKSLALAASLLLSMSAAALNLNEDHPDTYTVVKGDTLWDISATFLENPWQWPDVWAMNDDIKNPHLIYPGDIIKLVYRDGKPLLVVERVIRMSPTVRIESERESITTIPLEAVAPFFGGARIFTNEDDFNGSAYVLQGTHQNLIVGAGQQAYVKGAGSWDSDIKNYGVYRPARAWTDPITGEFLGFEAVEVGMSSVLNTQDDIATVEIVKSEMEIRPGDRVIEAEDFDVHPEYFPAAPDEQVEGMILDVEGGVTQVGSMNVVLLNRGARESLKEGNVVAIWKAGETIRDPITGKTVTLPSQYSGLAMIFKTYDKLSYALVMESDRPLKVGDSFKSP